MAHGDNLPTVLLTGGTGFIGRNIAPVIAKSCNLLTPSRAELDLLDEKSMRDYVIDNNIDVIVHSANPNAVKNPKADSGVDMFSGSLQAFSNVYRVRDLCERVLYFGSGAEYNKAYDISLVSEDKAACSFPSDEYGAAKYIMNLMARESNNVTNLRVFGCYGPFDHESKFITHCIRSVALGKDIAIRQDCLFDYLQVYDLGKVTEHFIHTDPRYRDYNVVSGSPVLLSDIAQVVLEEMDSGLQVEVLKPGLNNEYTASVARLAEETDLPQSFASLREGVQIQIRHEMDHIDEWGIG